MLYLHRIAQRTPWCALAALLAVLVVAGPALACPVPETSRAFSPAGDDTEYAAVPGGSFQHGLTWSVTGNPSVVAAATPLADDGASVRLQPGDSVTSPSFCIDRFYRFVRLGARATDTDAKLQAVALWTGDDGKPKQTPLDDLDANRYRTWGPSHGLRLRGVVPKDGGVRDIRLRFTAEGGRAGGWLLDDVHLAYRPPQTCSIDTATQAFASWGDDALYVGVPGGSFEDGLTWVSTGSPGVVAADNPLAVGGTPSQAAVQLGSGDSITSPVICLDRYTPTVRFAAHAADSASTLKLTVLWTDPDGNARQTLLAGLDAKRQPAWAPSRILDLKDAVPADDAVRNVRLRFSISGLSGTWLLDDVYVDPFRRC